jgi:hypothetical protein
LIAGFRAYSFDFLRSRARSILTMGLFFILDILEIRRNLASFPIHIKVDFSNLFFNIFPSFFLCFANTDAYGCVSLFFQQEILFSFAFLTRYILTY